MKYVEKLENVSVLGAAGKMGSGILLLTVLEMAEQSLMPENAERDFVLNAIDVSSEALKGLLKYVKVQVLKAAEKKIVLLRSIYKHRSDLIDNSEIINQYVDDVMLIIRPSINIEAAYNSTLIFEAIKEDPALKVKIFSQINKNNPKQPWFFTNTSSIPINELDEKAELNGRILGFHFYNPPAIQKLVEVIKSNKTLDEVVEFANKYGKNLRKVLVASNDIAGFIGNGHFMRDALYGIKQSEKLCRSFTFPESIYIINKISQDYLVRPMGIFQLTDYVGIDVCKYIMSVMNPYMKDEDIYSPILTQMLEVGVCGGQNSDGSQKNGFLKYEKGKPIAIYDIENKKYVNIEDIQVKCDEALGKAPDSIKPWKAVVNAKNKEEVLSKYFNDLKLSEYMGAKLAVEYLKRSKEIGLRLVADKVASNEEDVNTVMLTGFFHAFGPINNYV